MQKQWMLIPLSLLLALTASAGEAGDGKRGSRLDAKQHFERLDSDADGSVSRAEAAGTERLENEFGTIDGNRDGQISAEEYQVFVKARRSEQREKAKARIQQRWADADSNGDGMISRAEAEQGLPMIAKRFDTMDSDQDGKISQQELFRLSQRRHETSPQ